MPPKIKESLKKMLSNLGIIFSSISLLLSFFLIFSFAELKISKNKISKKIYKFSLVTTNFFCI